MRPNFYCFCILYPKTEFEKPKEGLPLRDRETRLVLYNGKSTITIWLYVYQLMEAGVSIEEGRGLCKMPVISGVVISK
jgi:hypothetical protein